MKKIINRKMYNTETAEKVAGYWNGLSSSDFGCLEMALYCKKNGEYFLYGHGGPMTRYAQAFGNSRSGGEDITPLTADEAMNWVERFDNEHFEEIFGAVSE